MMQLTQYGSLHTFLCHVSQSIYAQIYIDSSIRHTLYSEVAYANPLELTGRVASMSDNVRTIVLSDLWMHTHTFGL
jgi:hypothetical protein